MTHFVTLCEHDPVADLLRSFRNLQKAETTDQDKQFLRKLEEESDSNLHIYQNVVKEVLGGLDCLLSQEPEQLVLVFNLLFSAVTKLKDRAVRLKAEANRGRAQAEKMVQDGQDPTIKRAEVKANRDEAKQFMEEFE